ncbi:MAG: InlB B-repeat-containing protein [Lachnospiraceae bacterium]
MSGNETVGTADAQYGQNMPEITEVPTLPGYTFEGYYDVPDGTDVNGVDPYYNKDLQSNKTVDFTESKTLYAHWTPVSYFVYYQQGATQLAAQKVTYGGDMTVYTENQLSNVDIPAGYRLSGYSLTQNGQVQFTPGQNVVIDENDETDLWKDGKDRTLYVITTKDVTYTVSYEANGGYNVPTDNTQYIENQKVTVNFDTTPKRTGYTFVGWAESSEASEESDQIYKQNGPMTSFLITKDTKLYAVWKPNTYTIAYDANGGETAENVILEQETNYAETPILIGAEGFSKEGYTLIGWATNPYGSVAYGLEETLYQPLTTANDAVINLYAVWKANTYTVVYDKNNDAATGTAMKNQTMTYDTETTLRNNTFRLDGNIFDGWSTEPEGEVEFDNAEAVSNLTAVQGDTVTLYAVWSSNAEYTVTYEGNGGYNIPVDRNEYVLGATVEVQLDPVPKRSGYTFAGWAESANAAEPVYKEGGDTTFEINGDTKLYAIWTPNEYIITYDVNGGDGEPVVDRVAYEADYTFNDTTAKTGYTLLGWATNKYGSVTYGPGEIMYQPLTDKDGVNITLYAIWQANTYEVTYDANSDSAAGEMESQTMTYDAESTLTENVYQLAGYKFLGWSREPDGEVVYGDKAEVKNLTDTADETIILYAQWEKETTPGTDPGTTPGTDPGTTPGTDPGTTPGTDPGTTPGTDPGAASGTDAGSAPGTDTGAAPDNTKGDTPDEQAIIDTLKVTADTAKKILELAKQLDISMDVLLVTNESIQNQASEDVKGAIFGKLLARTSKIKNTSITLKWAKASQADGYLIYGNLCGTKNKYKLLKEVSAGTTSFTQSKLKKGTYYKYVILAYKLVDGQKVTIAASKTIHATTLGKKYGVAKAVKVNKSKVSLKKGKTFKIKSKEVKQTNTIKRHRKVAYESSNTAVATVSSKGVVKGVAKGTCYIYVYAQNGVYKQIKVTVK